MSLINKESVDMPEAFQALESKLKQDFYNSLERVTRFAWQRRRLGFLAALVSKLRSSEILIKEPATSANVKADSDEWVGIESLSRLRSLVGGRFENIKKKWIGAGLPLREHRGDKAKKAAIDQSGWADLSSWLLKHGFEARLLSDSSEFIFEVRRRN